MSNVIVTGGAGFIGSYICSEIIKNGDKCYAVDNLFQNSLHNIEHIKDKICFIEGDITDELQLKNIFDQVNPDILYHLAAHHFVPYCNNNPLNAINVNIIGTQNVINMCDAYHVSKIFFASTAAVYGISNAPHNESENANPVDIYGVTKYCGEKIVTFFHERNNATVIIGRLFNAIGSRETNPHILPDIFKQLGTSPLCTELHLGNAGPKRDYIHAADIASAACHVMSKAEQGSLDIVNIGTGHEYSVAQIVEMISLLESRKIDIVTDKDKVRPVDRLHLCADINKLKDKYQFTPQYTIQETLKQLLKELH